MPLNKPDKLAVWVVGHHPLDYPRNRLVKRSIENSGWNFIECHSTLPFPWRHFYFFGQFLLVRKKISVIWVTEGGHRLVPFLKLTTFLTGIKIIFDPFISRYNTRVEDRKIYAKNGFQAFICHWQDWSSTHMADYLIFDTEHHRQYFVTRYKLNKPSSLLTVGVDQHIFKPLPASKNPNTFNVLFYGTYIPLQGIETIVLAAKSLKKYSDIKFTLIGNGQTFNSIQSLIINEHLTNITQLPPIPEQNLPATIAEADVCLGIFGTTDKADRVVPNKVVQCAMMGKPVLTRYSKGVSRYFTDRQNILFSKLGDSDDLALKILELHSNPILRNLISKNGQSISENFFGEKNHTAIIKDILEKNVG